jgi:pyruvate ferredoxin oxidoreductase beta subunit
MEVISTPYPETAWKLPWIHGAFENSSSIASGVSAALKAKGTADKIKVVAFGGDGSTYDIGFGHLSGAFERGEDFTYVCYDNEAYMNTGIQRSGATPFGASTTTSPAGKESTGKMEWKKDIIHILAAHGSPYVASASIGFPQDAYKKLKTAMETKGPTFVNLFASCPTGWRMDPSKSIEIAKLAVDTGAVPLYEIVDGKHHVSRPTDITKLKPIEEYLKAQGRYGHLFKPVKREQELGMIQERVKANLKRILDLAEKGF